MRSTKIKGAVPKNWLAGKLVQLSIDYDYALPEILLKMIMRIEKLNNASFIFSGGQIFKIMHLKLKNIPNFYLHDDLTGEKIKNIDRIKKYVVINNYRFIFNERENIFEQVYEIEGSKVKRYILFGENRRDEDFNLLVNILQIIFNLGNLYTLFVLTIWVLTDYKIYSTIIALIIILNMIYYIYKNIIFYYEQKESRRKYEENYAHKLIGEKKIRVPVHNLLPGDIFTVHDQSKEIYADGIIIENSILVNEAFLTGESIPILKSKGDRIFSGSKILKNNQGKIQVTEIGFNTQYGNLIRQFNFRTEDPLFIKETFDIIKLMAYVAVFLTAVSIPVLFFIFKDWEMACIYSLDLFTVLIAPSLIPTIRTGLSRIVSKLKCIEIKQVESITKCGQVDIAIFDKTGTLTEDRMDVGDYTEDLKLFYLGCHTVLPYKDGLIGDSMEIAMVEKIGGIFDGENWIMRENNFCIKILEVEEFTAEKKYMSTVIEHKGETYRLYKGAPEAINRLQPINLEEYKELALDGYRVLATCIEDSSGRRRACGYIKFNNRLKKSARSIINELQRGNIQSRICTGDSLFTAISAARNLKIGDNFLIPVLKHTNLIFTVQETEIYNWYSTSIIDSTLPIAVDGEHFDFIRNNDIILYKEILFRGRIFARMTPKQKMHLVEDLKSFLYRENILEHYLYQSKITSPDRRIENHIAFIGDGANDSGAMYSADVGVSISPHIKFAPFICKNDLDGFLMLLKEGQNSIAISFFIIANTIISSLIQYIAMAFCMIRSSILSEYQTMYQDIFLITLSNLIISQRMQKNLLRKKQIELKTFLMSFVKFMPVILCTALIFLFYFSHKNDIIDETLQSDNSIAAVMFFVKSLYIFLFTIYLNRRGIDRPFLLFIIFNGLFFCWAVYWMFNQLDYADFIFTIGLVGGSCIINFIMHFI